MRRVLGCSAALFASLALAAPAAAVQPAYFSDFDGGIVGRAVIGDDGRPSVPLALMPNTGADSEGAAISPNGKRLLINGDEDLYGFAIRGGGGLADLDGSPFAHGVDTPYGVTFTPGGTLAYAAIEPPASAGFTTFGGALAAIAGAEFPAGADPRGLAASPNGKFLFSTDSDNKVGAYRIDGAGGIGEAPGNPFSLPAGASPYAISITPNGRYLYVATRSLPGDEAVVGFAVGASGLLTELDGSPFAMPGSNNPFGSTIDPSGRHLYVTDYDGGGLYWFRINGDGSLAPGNGSPAAGSTASASTPAITPDGRFLLRSSGNDNSLDVYALGPGGKPTLIPDSPFAVLPGRGDFQSIAIVPAQPPKAKLKAKSKRRRKVKLNAGRSTDTDGEIERYRWSFGDGKKKITTSPRVTHRYRKPGRYKAKVRLTDETGCSTKYVAAGQTPYCNGSKRAKAKKRVRARR